jgi:uncharacterized membrane protein
MRRRSIDLALASLVASLALVAALIGFASGVWGAIFGVPLVFVLPGYTIVAVLVERRTDLIERVAMSILLSIAVVILGGFLLNVLPGGLRTGSWALWLWAVTISGSVVAFARRRADAASNGARVALELGSWRRWVVALELGSWRRWVVALAARGRRLRARDGALIVAAVVLFFASTNLAVNWAAQPHGGGFTQLWIQRDLSEQAPAVLVGMTNNELTPQRYQLTFAVDQATTHIYAIFLSPGEHWQQTIAVTPAYLEGVATVDAQLYRAGEPNTVYRHVHLDLVISNGSAVPTVTVTPGQPTPTVALPGHPRPTATAGHSTPTVTPSVTSGTTPGTTPTVTPPDTTPGTTPTVTPPDTTPTVTP